MDSLETMSIPVFVVKRWQSNWSLSYRRQAECGYNRTYLRQAS
jgi:hypothetical protein